MAIAQREREIEDIAKGIIELSEIFKELQTMVIDQGTMLDRIDYNVELTRDRVKDAHVDLGQVLSVKQNLLTFLGFNVPGTESETHVNVTVVSGDPIAARNTSHKTVETFERDNRGADPGTRDDGVQRSAR